MLFLPNDDKLAALAKQIIEDVVKAEGRCHIVGWRDVPVVKEVVGPLAKATEPRIVQVRSHSSTPQSWCLRPYQCLIFFGQAPKNSYDAVGPCCSRCAALPAC